LKKLENKIKTSIWYEKAADNNPFYAEKSYCHGYDFYNDLLGNYSWTELVFLHLKGELPATELKNHFNVLLAAVMNPGPRDLQNRAAMSAAIGGCPVGGALMAGFSCAMGELQGGLAVEAVMRMLLDIKRQTDRSASFRFSYDTLTERYQNNEQIPGFGFLYAEQDTQAIRLLKILQERQWDGNFIRLLVKIETIIAEKCEHRMRLYGVFGASLLDLGFSPEQGHGLYMLAGGAAMLGFLSERYTEKWYEYPTWFSDAVYNYERKSGNEYIKKQ
jgi:citrate synthase